MGRFTAGCSSCVSWGSVVGLRFICIAGERIELEPSMHMESRAFVAVGDVDRGSTCPQHIQWDLLMASAASANAMRHKTTHSWSACSHALRVA